MFLVSPIIQTYLNLLGHRLTFGTKVKKFSMSPSSSDACTSSDQPPSDARCGSHTSSGENVNIQDNRIEHSTIVINNLCDTTADSSDQTSEVLQFDPAIVVQETFENS